MIELSRYLGPRPATILVTLACMALPLVGRGVDTMRPNVIMILADDQGWGDLGISGNTDLETPHIDSLARDGASMERFYVCPVCSPTRAEMLTGRYHTRMGVSGTSRGEERMNVDEVTLGDTFKAAGYATGAFGKWHNGSQWPYHPNARGFDEFYGFASGHWGHYFSPELEHNGRLVKGDGYLTDDLTNHAIEFMEQNKDRPFFCYLPYNIPHAPMQVPDRFWKKFEGADLKMRRADGKGNNSMDHTRAALAMCENIDWNVGRVLRKVDELGLAEQSIVIYFSDNGPNGWRWNGGMKGRKGSTDEGGVRSPCFIRWPAKIRPGTTLGEIAGAIDLLPTLVDLCRIPRVGTKTLDGVSLRPLLLGAVTDWPERMLFSTWGGRVSVRTPKYRLDHEGKLFDMEADPGQQTDVAAAHPALQARLTEAVADWKQDTGDPGKPRPFTVGHPGARVTHLPARDATMTGTIQRSSVHPNCSFFTNWSSTDDSITWDIEVLTAGRYEVQIYYSCKEENVGTQLEVSFGDSRLEGRITEAHDPPLVGMKEDRTERSESYVKDFQPATLGTLQLPAMRGPLTLRSTDIPGSASVDVRYICLTRIDNLPPGVDLPAQPADPS